LEVGIPMGCAISPLLFVLATGMVLIGVGRFAKGVKVGVSQVMPTFEGLHG